MYSDVVDLISLKGFDYLDAVNTRVFNEIVFWKWRPLKVAKSQRAFSLLPMVKKMHEITF